MPDLHLEVPAYTSASEWRWTLTDVATGSFLAEHAVRLDATSSRFEAFTDLNFYASWHTAPDRTLDDEARLASELGDWIGAEVLGPAITSALMTERARGHVTVRVLAPADLALRPLELARIDGSPLAQRDITLIMAPPGIDTAIVKPRGERLRILGLFSLPDGEQPANLRQARHCLVTLTRGIEARGGAADLTVLQYGVTRDRLRDVLEDGEGWDIIHIAGHGAPGSLVLETSAGRPDPITAGDLSALLDLARARVKLVTIAACQSAAEPDQPHDYPERILAAPPSAPASLASELAASLNCAVLAMRFGVTDEFASDLTAKLYDLLLDKGRDLPSALAITLQQIACRDAPHPALSVAAPALFGAGAAGLVLKAPRRPEPRSYSTASLTMAGFPPPPDRFVGRTGVMARASAVLASESGVPGVVLYGMPGGGKTACALELAYTHEHAFERLVWFKAPDKGSAIDGSLTNFALALEQYLDGFEMAHLVGNADRLTSFLPKLTALLKRRRLLIVIDNAESLTTNSGQWRDALWGQVIDALTAHTGQGRVIITTRRVSSDLFPALGRESVDTLSPGEARLLTRELPNLRRLPSDTLADVLHAAGGHPKLLELANGQATDPDPKRLAALTESGDPPSSTEGYLQVLTAWTNTVTDTLSPGERDLFWFLCCLEEPDRIWPMVKTGWTHLWQELGHDEDPPTLDQALVAIAARCIATIRGGGSDGYESYEVHPGVASAGLERAGHGFRNTVDIVAADCWDAVSRLSVGLIGDGTTNTMLLARAGLAAAPYLVRQHKWDRACFLLETALSIEQSPAVAATALPIIEAITGHCPRAATTLARILAVLDPTAAEPQLLSALDNHLAHDNYSTAGLVIQDLINLCIASGRLAEALRLITQKADFDHRADKGPWTQLSNEVSRLDLLNKMGHAHQVFPEAQRLYNRMHDMPAAHVPNETAYSWNVREMLFDVGRFAALQLEMWQEALDFNAALAASMRSRNARAADIARAWANNYGPLMQLDRINEALAILLKCRDVFHSARDVKHLGKTLAALAQIEYQKGHGIAAGQLQRDALRYTYLAGDVISIAVSYHNLGVYTWPGSRQPTSPLASYLAAALIRALTGIDGPGDPIAEAADILRTSGNSADLPAEVADLCRTLSTIDGTDPAGLIAKLSPNPETAERTLQDLIAHAQALAEEPPDDDHEQDAHPDDGNKESSA